MRSLFEAKPIAKEEYRICANCKQHLDQHTSGAENSRIWYCDPEAASPYFFPAFRQMDVLDLIEYIEMVHE